MKPIAFIDVDGVLNRLCSDTAAQKRGGLIDTYGESRFGRRFKFYLDKSDADRLHSLEPDFELAWGTTWEDSANEQVGQQIGLRNLSLVARAELRDPSKWAGIVRAAEGRPFVWFEDDTYYSKRFNETMPNPPQDFLIIEVDPLTGLTDDHIVTAKEWLNG